MPNRHRIHVPGGTYYIFRRTDSRHPIFSSGEDYVRFEKFLERALASSGAKLLAHCCLPEAFHLVIEIGRRPVADFMRDLMWRYSRAQGQCAQDERPSFRKPYQATLILERTYLVALMCHVHYLPIRAGLAQQLDDYPYSSHHSYSGRATTLSLHLGRILALLGCRNGDRTAYNHAVAEPPSEVFTGIFERGLPDTPGVVGDYSIVKEQAKLQSTPLRPESTRQLDQLIQQIADYHGVSLEELCSNFRRRDLVIARAQITWYAILWKLASVNELARRLRHSPSALSRAATRYRRLRPELFTPETAIRMNRQQAIQARFSGI